MMETAARGRSVSRAEALDRDINIAFSNLAVNSYTIAIESCSTGILTATCAWERRQAARMGRSFVPSASAAGARRRTVA